MHKHLSMWRDDLREAGVAPASVESMIAEVRAKNLPTGAAEARALLDAAEKRCIDIPPLLRAGLDRSARAVVAPAVTPSEPKDHQNKEPSAPAALLSKRRRPRKR